MQDSDWPTISPFVIDDNWQQAPPNKDISPPEHLSPFGINGKGQLARRSWMRKLKLMKVAADEDKSWRRVVDEDGTPSINQEIYSSSW